ncbi:MAG TPA: hypothetical protein VEX39_02855 [Thermoleophilaceae bacterium]|nr:hypothetical protein [Thermoleophilaceae bacterium]
MLSDRGQATIEWVGLICLASLGLGALALVIPVVDGRSLGGFLSHRIVCAVRGAACADGALRRYGASDAALVRRFAPGVVYEPGERQLPVDFRRCRVVRCARAPDDPDLDAHRTDAGGRATLFTRVVRAGGRTYIQYWLYYPDSNSAVLGSDEIWRRAFAPMSRGRAIGLRPPAYPGYHRDDWEGHQVRIDRDGTIAVRSTAHGHHQWCKQAECRGRWGSRTGWTRVSRGSHAGHIPLERTVTGRRGGGRAQAPRGRLRTRYRARLPGVDLRERTTTPEGIELVPLEWLDKRGYRRLGKGVTPPWQKRLYDSPEDPGS